MTVLLATTTVMGVEDRIREHAVLQTLGVTGPARVSPRAVGMRAGELSSAGLTGVLTAIVVLSVSSLSVGAEAVSIAFAPSTFNGGHRRDCRGNHRRRCRHRPGLARHRPIS